MINTGAYQIMVDQAAATGVDVSPLEALPGQIASITPQFAALSLSERVFSMLGHVGFSILVFYAVRKSRIGVYLLAVLSHALFDVPAVLYQQGVISLYVVEASLPVYTVIFFAIIYLMFYKKLKS